MLKRIAQLTLSLLLCLMPTFSYHVNAETTAMPQGIVINELQLNGSADKTTGEEFVEIANIGSESVDISGWKLQYIASTGNRGTAKYFITFPANTTVYPGGYITVTSDIYITELVPKLTYAITASFAGLASSGGTVELTNALGVAIDTVGWGTKTTTICETELAIAPPDGSSIQRKLLNNTIADSNNNKNDFEVLVTPTPSVINIQPDPEPLPDPDPEPNPDPLPDSQPEPTVNPDTVAPPVDNPPAADTPITEEIPPNSVAPPMAYVPILVNELFIDPATPQTDASDEWVELYNPNDTPQDLNGYTLYAGESYSYRHTFGSGMVISGHGYITITSADTSIALSNGGGAVKIVGPTNEIYDLTKYETAKTGYSWAKDKNGNWLWSITPTQNTENIITEPTPAAVIATAAKAVKKPTAKTIATAKTAVKKVATPTKAATKTTKVKAVADSTFEPALVPAPSPIPIWLLAGLGTLAVLYSAYEYRFDMANKIYQLKANRAARVRNRRAP